jgi:hypothetical protein
MQSRARLPSVSIALRVGSLRPEVRWIQIRSSCFGLTVCSRSLGSVAGSSSLRGGSIGLLLFASAVLSCSSREHVGKAVSGDAPPSRGGAFAVTLVMDDVLNVGVTGCDDQRPQVVKLMLIEDVRAAKLALQNDRTRDEYRPVCMLSGGRAWPAGTGWRYGDVAVAKSHDFSLKTACSPLRNDVVYRVSVYAPNNTFAQAEFALERGGVRVLSSVSCP